MNTIIVFTYSRINYNIKSTLAKCVCNTQYIRVLLVKPRISPSSAGISLIISFHYKSEVNVLVTDSHTAVIEIFAIYSRACELYRSMYVKLEIMSLKYFSIICCPSVTCPFDVIRLHPQK